MGAIDVSRRAFLAGAGGSAAVAPGLAAGSYRRVRGANERVGLGFIGFGLIGKRHVLDFADLPGARGVAVSDPHDGRMAEAAGLIGDGARRHRDFRRVLDDPDIDAVVVSTPDHWHALMTMMACEAGKDVYVEKPVSLTVREGRWMVDVARRTGRVVLVGTQQRSGAHYRRARELIRSGHLGPVVSVRMGAYRNVCPGFGSPPDGDPPPGLDYDLWLGPAPARPYNPNRAIYHFRWFWDYSGGQMTNLGQHQLDVVDWALDLRGPVTVSAAGGRFCLSDNGETPDTMDALLAFDRLTVCWSHREGARGATPEHALEFHGTRGGLGISRTHFTVTADRRIPPANAVPQFTGAHPVGGPEKVPTADGPPPLWTEPIEDRSGSDAAQLRDHARHFLDCVRGDASPDSDLESGHRVASLCHLANLALRLGRSIRWDVDRERVLGDPEVESLLERPYRAPWDAELRAVRKT